MDNKRLDIRLVLTYTLPGLLGILAVFIDTDHPVCKIAPSVCVYMGAGGRPFHVMATLLVLFAWWLACAYDKRLAVVGRILEIGSLIFTLLWVFLVSVQLGGVIVIVCTLWRMFGR